MFRPRRPQLLPAPLRARIEASVRDGVGLSKHEWILPAPVRPHELVALGEAVVEWSRLRVAESRRPYGIDQSALAIACAHPGGAPLASATFGVFRPIELYAEGGIPERVQAFMEELSVETLNESGEPVRFAAALFSWGDVARATLFAGPE
ncbi:MAG: hypothetical protein EPO16_07030 [Dehalococcoidia bacterium]|nr:MAG: hypothetical protein EPO16_07030 [Dehalococcoidia bacterium]